MGELPFTAVLTVVDHAGVRSLHPFRHPRMLLGRSGDNDLTLADPNVSTHHCELAAELGLLVVRDLGSANGTYVNERRVSEARLGDGDVVRVGKTQIGVQLEVRRSLKGAFRGARKWLWLLGALAVAAGGALLYSHRQQGAEQRDVRRRVSLHARAEAQRDVCGPGERAFAALRSADAEMGSRSVAVEVTGKRLAPTRQGRETNAQLAELWRKKGQLYGAAASAVAERQQAGRDAVEKLSRLGARLRSAKDRSIVQWIGGLLGERVAVGDGLVLGLRARQGEAERFAELVDRLAQADAAAAQELGSFQFGPDERALLQRCEAEQQRLGGNVVGALSGLEVE